MLTLDAKIKTLQELSEILEIEKNEGKTIVHCHGVFDLVHPGHIKHLQAAKQFGDILVVSITPDAYVNKGPGRPVFSELLRLETLASLEVIDYVTLNCEPTAVTAIHAIRPSIYVKGEEYKDHSKDITGKITDEEHAVHSHGGTVKYTGGITFSSSSLLNAHFATTSKPQSVFLQNIKKKYSLDTLLSFFTDFLSMRVLVVGDAILDEYQFVTPLGQSGKGLHMSAELLDCEKYLGGSFAIARHLSGFTSSVSLLTGVGVDQKEREFIESHLEGNISPQYVELDGYSTLTKKRYVLRDGKHLSKLFETYSSNHLLLNPDQIEDVKQHLHEKAALFDSVVIADFGNGFFSPSMSSTISALPTHTSINTQINSGNRGFNAITKYKRADFVSLNEPELRLALHDTHTSLNTLARKLIETMNVRILAVTRGVHGVRLFSIDGSIIDVPALSSDVVDRVGAGDSFLSIASLAAAKGLPLDIIGFFGALAAALDIQIIGNKDPVSRTSLIKYMTRLLK